MSVSGTQTRGVTVHADTWLRLYEPRHTDNGHDYYSGQFIELRLARDSGEVHWIVPPDSDMRRGLFKIADLREALDTLEGLERF